MIGTEILEERAEKLKYCNNAVTFISKGLSSLFLPLYILYPTANISVLSEPCPPHLRVISHNDKPSLKNSF